MDRDIILDEINKLKREKRFAFSNIYSLHQIKNGDISLLLKNDNAVLYTIDEEYRTCAYFYANKIESLRELFLQIDKSIVVEIVFKNKETEQYLSLISEYLGFNLHTVFFRETIVWEGNPYEIPEKNRRKLLWEMYDPNFGENANCDDAEELFDLGKNSFEECNGDIITLQEWKKIIEEKRCLIYREDNRIVTYFVWRKEGRKLYTHQVLNLGPANYLYNLERRTFEKLWDEGIRVHYWWIDRNNISPQRRGRSDPEVLKLIKSREFLYNAIFVR